jgi:hypothetical protein
MNPYLVERPTIRDFPYYTVPGVILIRHQLGSSNDFFKALHLWLTWAPQVGPLIERKLTAKGSN